MKKQQKKHVSKAENPQTRSSSTSVENSESIPADLIFEIFSRLTAKSLSRFRCLSKEWASIFSSRVFTHSFVARSCERPRLLFTFHVDGKLFSYSTPQPPRNPDQDLSHVVVDNHITIPTRMGSFLIHRPVRGLLCPGDMWFERGCNDSKMMTIFNPSTGQFKKLPAARTRRGHVRTYLGYDPIKEEYKVLCMSVRRRTYPKFSEEHQVLTLGTGKLSWRMIECSLKRYPEIGGICINGVLYYLAYQNDGFGVGQNFTVICFDVSSEKFKPLEINLTCSSTLINYKGKLGAIQFDQVGFFGGRTTSLGLMVLDDAEQHIWSKKTYVLPPFWKNLGVDAIARLNVVGMTGDSEIVFSPSILSDPFYIFYYDVERNTVVKVRVQGIDFVKNQYIYTFMDYAEDVKSM